MMLSPINSAGRFAIAEPTLAPNSLSRAEQRTENTQFKAMVETQTASTTSKVEVNAADAVTDRLQLLLAQQMIQHMLPKGEGGFFGSDASSDHFNSILVDQLSTVLSGQIDFKIGLQNEMKA